MKHLQTLIVPFALLLVVTGCSGTADNASTLAKLNAQNIQRLANLYYAFQASHQWRGPEDEEEFREFIKTYPTRKLERIGISPGEVEGLFVNERDGEPFKVRYGVQGNMMGCSEAVIFEASGVGGKKMVGFLDMIQREVENDEYEKLWTGEMKGTAEGNRL